MELTTGLAIYGAALSSFIAVRGVWLSRDRLKVNLLFGAKDTIAGGAVVMQVLNFGRRPIMVSQVGLLWAYKRVTWREWLRHSMKYRRFSRFAPGWIHWPVPPVADPVEIPKLLEPGHSFLIWMPLEELRKSEYSDAELVAEVIDGLNRRAHSGRFRLPARRPLDQLWESKN